MPSLTSGPRTARPPCRPAVALITGILALTPACGCGGPDSGGESGRQPGVASIDRSAKAGSAEERTTAPAAEGVRLRLDSTEEEKRLVNNAYSACLKEEGVPTYTKGGGAAGGGAWVFPQFDAPAMREAAEACKEKKPLPPPELDKEKNPHYTDDFREQLQCMEKRGVGTRALPDAGGYDYVGTLPPDYPTIEEECELEAFGGGSP